MSCGGHSATTCSECGTIPRFCNADCEWEANRCVSKAPSNVGNGNVNVLQVQLKIPKFKIPKVHNTKNCYFFWYFELAFWYFERPLWSFVDILNTQHLPGLHVGLARRHPGNHAANLLYCHTICEKKLSKQNRKGIMYKVMSIFWVVGINPNGQNHKS